MLNETAIVILNWNGKSFLERFLPSVIRTANGAQVIVADNASTDDSVSYLKANFPEIHIIQNSSNGGFAKGYNEALKQVDAEYYVLLNSDIEPEENWLQPLLEVMKDETVAGCQPKVLAYNQKTHFEHAGASGGFMDINYFPFCRGRILTSVEEDQGQYDGQHEIFWATGACLMIRANCFHEVEGFDEDFFAHMEEIDLCWRLKRKNYRFLVEPKSIVYHVGGGTLPYNSPRKTFLNFRNSLFMLTKNHQGVLFPKLVWRMVIDGVAAISFLAKGEFKQFGAVFKAHGAFYRKLGSFLKKRKALKKSSSTFNQAGLFRGNLLWNYYVKGVKKYSNLNKRLFH
ncbi:MAG: glycosyltransferase family 2 protein [Flavobacteriales bacterium]|nr:glycosyltransferase family 2 protein [Flavobacteriales bacterium]